MGFLDDMFSGPPEPTLVAPPNTDDTLEQQREATQVSQYTPYGNLIYGTYDADGNFAPRESGQALQVTESPFQEQFRGLSEDVAIQLAQGLNGNLGGFRSASDVESAITTPLLGDFANEALRIENETFEAAQRRLEPQIEQERDNLIQNLADRGIPLTSEAAQKELDRFDLSVSDRNQDAAYRAIDAGRTEQNRLAQLTAALRGQEINEQLALANLEQQQRAQQFGEIGALGGFASPFQPLNAPTVDAAGIINQGFANTVGANQFNNSARQSAYANQMAHYGDLATTGAQIYAMSDTRLKEDIKFVGHKNGYNLYEFNYKGGEIRYRGVMAQEVLETNPDAVAVMDNGYYGVYYDKLGFPMEVVS